MKMKQIRVGEEYAVGSPACQPGSSNWMKAARVRVVATCQTGEAYSLAHGWLPIETPRFVEVELISGGLAQLGVGCEMRVLSRAYGGKAAGYPAPRRRSKIPTRIALRVIPARILRPWAEHAAVIEETKQKALLADATRQDNEAKLLAALKVIDEHCGTDLVLKGRGYRPFFNLENLLKIAAKLESTLRDAPR